MKPPEASVDSFTADQKLRLTWSLFLPLQIDSSSDVSDLIATLPVVPSFAIIDQVFDPRFLFHPTASGFAGSLVWGKALKGSSGQRWLSVTYRFHGILTESTVCGVFLDHLLITERAPIAGEKGGI